MNREALGRLLTLAQREFQTLLRTRTVAVLAVGYLVIVLGLVVAAGTAGYLPLTLDLLRPVEVLVPILAFAFGYRAILADAERGELETIRTYPVSKPVFVAGVYLGRLAGFLAVVLVPLVIAALLVAAGGKSQVSVIAAHETIDSPAIYLRFVTLTALFAVVALTIATAISAVARSTREALALVAVLFLALVVGFDASIVAAVTGGVVSASQVEPLLAFSPNSAYRGLVFSLATGDVFTRAAPSGSPLLSLGGLLAWFGLSLAVAVRTVWRT
jgi:ABC-type transport system involved in multi-copper enzyme maturation permease subunit